MGQGHLRGQRSAALSARSSPGSPRPPHAPETPAPAARAARARPARTRRGPALDRRADSRKGEMAPRTTDVRTMACARGGTLAALPSMHAATSSSPRREYLSHETFPVSTGGGTRRVLLVREGGGGGGARVPPGVQRRDRAVLEDLPPRAEMNHPTEMTHQARSPGRSDPPRPPERPGPPRGDGALGQVLCCRALDRVEAPASGPRGGSRHSSRPRRVFRDAQ